MTLQVTRLIARILIDGEDPKRRYATAVTLQPGDVDDVVWTAVAQAVRREIERDVEAGIDLVVERRDQ